MIYDHTNAYGARVFDVPSSSEVRDVISVDTDRMVVTVAEMPFRVIAGSVATFTIHPDAIRVVNDKRGWPVLFLLNPVDDEPEAHENQREEMTV